MERIVFNPQGHPAGLRKWAKLKWGLVAVIAVAAIVAVFVILGKRGISAEDKSKNTVEASKPEKQDNDLVVQAESERLAQRTAEEHTKFEEEERVMREARRQGEVKSLIESIRSYIIWAKEGRVPPDECDQAAERLAQLEPSLRPTFKAIQKLREKGVGSLHPSRLNAYMEFENQWNAIGAGNSVNPPVAPAKGPPFVHSLPFVNSLGMRFMPVPITNGPAAGENILFSIWETRRRDYAAYASEKGDTDESWKNAEQNGQPVGHLDDHPVVCVRWGYAVDFCAWLTRKERALGKIPLRAEYRLPTDAEWSYAVGIGDREDASQTPDMKVWKIKGVYPWGTAWPPPDRVGNYYNLGEDDNGGFSLRTGYADGYQTTAPVGSLAANRYGLFDLGGNVEEWSGSKYRVERDERVLRGGSWGSSDGLRMLSSHRESSFSGSVYIGFRCVLVLSDD
jgi:hypothetical protein